MIIDVKLELFPVVFAVHLPEESVYGAVPDPAKPPSPEVKVSAIVVEQTLLLGGVGEQFCASRLKESTTNATTRIVEVKIFCIRIN